MMANIQEILTKILSSRYGKDMRQAIHDGIEQCYDDATEDSITIDSTLSNSGEAADAKATGDALKDKLNINQGSDKRGKIMLVGPDGNTIPDELPDESVTEEKLDPNARMWTTQRLSIISNKYQNSGYSGELFDQFTANINVFTDYIDASNYKTLYYRIYRTNMVANGKVNITIGCYDAEKNYLYTMRDSSGDYAGNFLTLRYVSVNENLNEQNVRVKAICRVNIPNEVKFVRFAIP